MADRQRKERIMKFWNNLRDKFFAKRAMRAEIRVLKFNFKQEKKEIKNKWEAPLRKREPMWK